MGRQENRADELAELVNGHPETTAGALPGPTDPDVRLAWVQRLPDGAFDEPQRTVAIDRLIRLTTDPVGEIRDWACFGLGQLDASDELTREALTARLDDPHDGTRCEALMVLAELGDPRAVEYLLRHLDNEPIEVVWTLELKAAAAVADPRLLPGLRRLADGWVGDDVELQPLLDRALDWCEAGERTTLDGRGMKGLLADAAGSIVPAGIMLRSVGPRWAADLLVDSESTLDYAEGPSEVLAFLAAEQRYLLEHNGPDLMPGDTVLDRARERLRRWRNDMVVLMR